MLDGLRQFITDIVAPHDQARAFGESDYRLAATALLIHVVSLDGQPTAAEQRKLHGLIESSSSVSAVIRVWKDNTISFTAKNPHPNHNA